MSWEDEDYAYTEMTPMLLDRMLDKNTFLIEKWNKMMAWHKAQKDWRNDEFIKTEAKAVMVYDGPATKAKYAAADNPTVILARTHLSIANAQLGICERRLHALEKSAINLALRNKLLAVLYNNS